MEKDDRLNAVVFFHFSKEYDNIKVVIEKEGELK